MSWLPAPAHSAGRAAAGAGVAAAGPVAGEARAGAARRPVLAGAAGRQRAAPRPPSGRQSRLTPRLTG